MARHFAPSRATPPGPRAAGTKASLLRRLHPRLSPLFRPQTHQQQRVQPLQRPQLRASDPSLRPRAQKPRLVCRQECPGPQVVSRMPHPLPPLHACPLAPPPPLALPRRSTAARVSRARPQRLRPAWQAQRGRARRCWRLRRQGCLGPLQLRSRPQAARGFEGAGGRVCRADKDVRPQQRYRERLASARHHQGR